MQTNTTALLDLAERNIVEAHLTAGGLRATHFFFGYHSDTDSFDTEGIDGEEVTKAREEILTEYPDGLGAIWTIDQCYVPGKED